MKFNAKKFSATADSVCQRCLPESHRLALDGREVIEGKIKYEVGEKEWYLYPVLSEWCDE